MRIESKNISVTTTALTGMNGEVKVVKGNLVQTFSRDSGEYEADRSVFPLVLMPEISVVDPDGVMSNGLQVITVVEWYIGHPDNGGVLITNDLPGFTISAAGEPAYSLKVAKNIKPDESIEIYARYSFVDKRVNKSVTMIRSVVPRTTYFDSGNFSLKLNAGNIINVNPIYCEKSGDIWPVRLSAQLHSGANAVADENAVYWWYVKEGGYYRKITEKDQFLTSGFGTKSITIDAAKINTLDILVRAAHYGALDPVPYYPESDYLKAGTVVMVRLPKKIHCEIQKVKGAYIRPGASSKPANTTIEMKAVVSDSKGVILSPGSYYNITWYAKLNTPGAPETVIGYGETLTTTSDALGITNLIGAEIYYNIEEKIGNTWNLEGSVFNGVVATSPAYQFGATQIADRLSAYLIKRNEDDTVQIIGKLMKNNWLRFEDGSPAPTMVESAETDLGYDVVYGWNETIHTIENATVGNEQIALFADSAFSFAGLASRPIKPTGISPSLPTLWDGKLRCMYFKFASVAGKPGQSNLINIARADRGHVKTEVTQLNVNSFALAKNVNPAKSIPFAPLMDWHLLCITNALYNKFRTVDLHAINKFGGGISSNETVNASSWGNVTGIRYKIGAETEWTYSKLSDTPAAICYDSAGSKTHWSAMVTQEYPRMRTMEIQMALSHAAENNIAPETEFTFDGEVYYYKNAEGATPLLSGEMNARLYKKIAFSFNAYNTSGGAISVNAELVLQSSAIYGIDLCSADVFQYAGAGIERVANISDAASGNNSNNICDVYLCTDQEYLDLTSDTTKPGAAKFTFEENPNYSKIGTTNQSGGYFTNPMRGTRYSSVRGGSLHSNAMYAELANYSSGAVGSRVRMGHRTRGYGIWPTCSALSLIAINAVSSASRASAGGFQVRLTGGGF